MIESHQEAILSVHALDRCGIPISLCLNTGLVGKMQSFEVCPSEFATILGVERFECFLLLNVDRFETSGEGGRKLRKFQRLKNSM